MDREDTKEYILSTLTPLEPVIRHGIEAICIAGIVRLTSLCLHLILPAPYAAAVDNIELHFYRALSAVLCLFTFVLFCWNLISHLWEELRIGFDVTRARMKRRLSELIPPTIPSRHLPSANTEHSVLDQSQTAEKAPEVER